MNFQIVTKRPALILFIICMWLVPVHAAYSCSELIAAAMSGDAFRISELHSSGENINCKDSMSAQTPLMEAATVGNHEAVETLLSLGADPNIENPYGHNALYLAQDSLKVFEGMPDSAPPVKTRKQIIALLQSKSNIDNYDPAASTSTVGSVDPDMHATYLLDSAYAATLSGDSDQARLLLNEVINMDGISQANRAHALYETGHIAMNTQKYESAKKACEELLTMSEGDMEERAFCKDNLKTIRKYKPKLFK